MPYALLRQVSGRLINEVRSINSVAYELSGMPRAIIEWE